MSQTEPDTPLYAAREPVFPRRVSGNFRTLKWWLLGFMLGIYYLIPWLRWDRGPMLPDQAVLLDLGNRRFFFFMIEIWPHEFYFVAGLLIMAGLGLFLFTSALGRVWCGYACPQTVWTDLFLLIERWVDGDRNNQLRLLRQQWDLHKLRLRLVKWTLWLLIALATGGAWVFYFTDAPALASNLIHGTAHPVAYSTIAVLTATTFLFGGFMREQMCIYACPWPRIQAAMMDEDTITIAYREWRGEPRGKHRKAEGAEALGDCIDCMACANVCPMGIDIRDGQQLECITCGLCIDACDEMMDKVGKPRGLVAYMALKDEAAERAGAHPKQIWKHMFRPRTLMYFTLWAGIGIALVVALFMRPPFEFNVSPVRNPQYVLLADGSIRNTYEVRLRNKQPREATLEISLVNPKGDHDFDEDEGTVQLTLEGRTANVVTVAPDETLLQRVYVTAPRGSDLADESRTNIRFWLRDVEGTERISADSVFNGKDH
ncbi:cytochrome c oxidase accessory protein CcoG [Phaeovulum sp.]|uniref:cytochrome c oxidase accessory protein CcoG n=1 Tax=Phaeovulum sp. TaxID=2934796 RepID=UPI002730A351|nr:cytochrome c oxidase accessory protein CcoG [Phaeovulum sp.]MDP1667983.1 cytochrome c oxidase accessory protein CcoG [Phaeovulum sp.]MDZ4119432.1 cytochrome c oxidase accessory protein CcoG [Phaeovulum sp.]